MMKKIKKTQSKGFYIFSGEVVPNNNFIETLDEAKQFLIYANYFLKDYLIVYDYVINRSEWHMIVKLKSAEEIYNVTSELEESRSGEQIWRVISERMRLFLSRYVLKVNRMRGRTGTLVHSSYDRFFFESLQEAKQVIAAIREQTFRMYRRKPKYRGMKIHYKISKKLGSGSIFLCSKEMKSIKKKERNFLENQYLSSLRDLVLSKMVTATKNLHHHKNIATFSPQIM